MNKTFGKIFITGAILLGGIFFIPKIFEHREPIFLPKNIEIVSNQNTATTPEIQNIIPEIKKIEATHINTPEIVKGIYMTSWVAGTPKLRDKLINFIDRTEANAVIIDIKDYSGRLSFIPNDEELRNFGSGEKRIGDIDGLIKILHDKNIYVIGRISVFQDPFFVSKNRDESVLNPEGNIWKDRKGLSWADPASEKMWNYIKKIGEESYSRGFDELNFDYIRFPTDGKDTMVFPISKDRPKSEVILSFFQFLNNNFRQKDSEKNIPISADLFGLTTTAGNDMGIGQIFENAILNFDFVAPMIYPSHYAPGSFGYVNPAGHPYEIIKKAMEGAIKKTEKIGGEIGQIRPWLQDFDMGTIYTKDMVIAQIQALYDLKISSFMLWDPANTYTEGVLEKDSVVLDKIPE